jgi:hypothetical protein
LVVSVTAGRAHVTLGSGGGVGTEMRVEASLRILENPDLREVHVPHRETSEPVLVSREEILEHTEVDGRVLEADVR